MVVEDVSVEDDVVEAVVVDVEKSVVGVPTCGEVLEAVAVVVVVVAVVVDAVDVGVMMTIGVACGEPVESVVGPNWVTYGGVVDPSLAPLATSGVLVASPPSVCTRK